MTTMHDAEEPGGDPNAGTASLYRIAGIVWCFLTTLLCAHFVAVEYVLGGKAASRFVQLGPMSDGRVTATCVAVTWMLVGVLIALLRWRKITPANIVTVSGFFVIAFLYINILRERWEFADVGDYTAAAWNLYEGKPLHRYYLYPPFWANFLELFVFAGVRRSSASLCS
jgi:hypothetical protein